MSAAAPTPEPTGLSESQRRVLDDLAAHENAADPGYVLRMNAPARPGRGALGGTRAETIEATAARGRRRDRLVQLTVVAVMVAVVLPPAWTIAIVLTVALVVGPTYLVVMALRDGGLDRRRPGPDPSADPDSR